MRWLGPCSQTSLSGHAEQTRGRESLWAYERENSVPGIDFAVGDQSAGVSSKVPSGLGFGLRRSRAAIRPIRCCAMWMARSVPNASFWFVEYGCKPVRLRSLTCGPTRALLETPERPFLPT